MKLKNYDGKCVRITASSGEVYEGVVSYCGREYVFHEYGQNEEALLLVPLLFCKSDITDIVSLEEVNGPFGHFSDRYGLLEKKCLEWGTDLIEEVFDTENDIQILRMLTCMNDNFHSLSGRAVRGMAPWRSEKSTRESEEDEDEQGPVYLEELERMLISLVKHSGNDDVIKAAKAMLERLADLPLALPEANELSSLKSV